MIQVGLEEVPGGRLVLLRGQLGQAARAVQPGHHGLVVGRFAWKRQTVNCKTSALINLLYERSIIT